MAAQDNYPDIWVTADDGTRKPLSDWVELTRKTADGTLPVSPSGSSVSRPLGEWLLKMVTTPDIGRATGNLLFADDFRRADTTNGTLGEPPLGQPVYTMYAPWVSGASMPAATQGKISGNKFIGDVGAISYAAQTCARTVKRLKGIISFTTNPAFDSGQGATGAATAAFLIKGTGSYLVEDMGLHVTIARAGDVKFQKRYAGGAFVDLGKLTGGAQHGLVHNVAYPVEMWISDNGDWGMTINGRTLSGNDPTLPAHLSSTCACEVFQNGANHVDLVRFHSFEAYDI